MEARADVLTTLLRASKYAPDLTPLITALLLAELLASGAHGPVPKALGGARPAARRGGRTAGARGRLVARSSLSGRRARG